MKLQYLVLFLYTISLSCVWAGPPLLSGAPSDICTKMVGSQNSRMSNMTTIHCSSSVTFGSGPSTAAIETCIETQMVNATTAEACTVTVLKVGGTEVIKSPCSTANTTNTTVHTKLCKTHGADNKVFCIEMLTDDISKCTNVTYDGNKIFTFCSCTLYNEYFVQILQKIPNCKRKTKMDDDIQIHYRAMNLANKKEFDNSYYNNVPVKVKLGIKQFMKGWDIGLIDMCEGEVRRLTIPYRAAKQGEILSYPYSPHPHITTGDTLSFEIKLIKIEIPRDEI